MPENPYDLDPANADQESSPPTDTPLSPSADALADPVATTIRFPIRGLAIVLVLAAIIIGATQWYAPTLDYQNANMITVLVGFLVLAFCVMATHRVFRSSGRRFLVPGISIAVAMMFIGLFRLDGFSGEMLPQLSWRFGSDDRGQWLEPAAKSELESTAAEAEAPKSIAAENSLQFLGPNRSGVISKRLFSVPESNRDVEVLWDQPIGDGWSSFAVHRDRAVTLEQRDDKECVTCYRLSDGKLLWIDEHAARHANPLGGVGPRSTPAIHTGKVYAMGAMGLLRVLDLQTGKRVWTKDLLEEAGWTTEQFLSAAPWGHASSPLVVESQGFVVVGFGGPVDEASVDSEGMTPSDKSLIAMDLETGETKWTAGRDQFSYASPMWMTLAGQAQIVSVNEKTITGHVPESGETLWSIDWPGSTNTSANCASAIAVNDQRFVIGKGYGGGSAVVEITASKSEGFDAEIVWSSNRVLKTKFNHTLVQDGIGFGLSNGTLQAADLTSGESLWSQSRGQRFGQGQVVLAEDVLVAQTEPGDVVFVAADPESYRELGRLKSLSSKTWNIPTVAGRHLLVRNDRQAICYWLPANE